MDIQRMIRPYLGPGQVKKIAPVTRMQIEWAGPARRHQRDRQSGRSAQEFT
ncbi:MAG: hypothetical protein ACNA7J_13850 [Wenzhouxiangella sp.]